MAPLFLAQPLSRRRREQGGDIRQCLDADGLVRIELTSDLRLDRQHQAQMRETVPAFEPPNADVVGNRRRVAIGSLGQ